MAEAKDAGLIIHPAPREFGIFGPVMCAGSRAPLVIQVLDGEMRLPVSRNPERKATRHPALGEGPDAR